MEDSGGISNTADWKSIGVCSAFKCYEGRILQSNAALA